MKTTALSPSTNHRAYALMITVILTAVTLLVLAATLRLTSGECRLTGRHNLYTSALAAAEGGTERVMAQMERDFVNLAVSSNLNNYASIIPDQTGWPTRYQFSDGRGNVNKARVTSSGSTVGTNLPKWVVLDSSFKGLYGMVTPYQVSSRATTLNQGESVSATVSQDFQLALIPVFQFAIFYNMDLEINPGADMDITGKVHSNANLYTAPGASLRYLSDVSFVNNYYRNRHPDDPNQSTGRDPSYSVGTPPGPTVASSMTLPIGTNNTPAAVAAILDPPPFDEDPTSALGQQRFLNKADIIISNSPTGITVKSGKWNNFTAIPTNIPTGTGYSFITTSNFYDYREKKTVVATQFDVAKFNTWVSNTTATGGASLNTQVKLNTGHGLNSIYVFNTNSTSASTLNAVRVMNGSSLPSDGLSVATPLPLYVWGNFNLNNGSTTAGNTNTALTKPAALIGDAITVLSGKYLDSYSATVNSAINARPAQDTTINAAFLSGIVTTKRTGGSPHYSGGVENFPRFLENWSSASSTLTYNGSMVVMFPSRYATNFWFDPGTGAANYYTAPQRRWAFDVNFMSQNRLPPMTPNVRKLLRQTWASR